MAYLLVEGYRVFRGPDWCYGDVDGGEGSLGTVVDTDEEGKVEVIWDNGATLTCRAGSDGKYDLRVFDTGPAGVRHKGQACVVCETADIQGAAWRCTVCRKCVLCSRCYLADKHDTDHAFLRLDFPNCDGERVAARSVSEMTQTKGIFPSCSVCPGLHCGFMGLEGGAVHKGTVDRLDKTAGKMYVKWGNGQTTLCRLGYRGHVDLRCENAVPGFYCYREHVPVLDLKKVKIPELVWSKSAEQTTTQREQRRQFEMNERVFIELTQNIVEDRKTPQEEGSTVITRCAGKVGVVRGVATNGDVIVHFQGLQLTLDPKILRKMPILLVGDTVRIEEDEEKVKIMQEEHGGWNVDMKRTLGKVGKVRETSIDGDAIIAFGDRTWLYNPACCSHAPGATPDSISTGVSFATGGTGLFGTTAAGTATAAAAGAGGSDRSNAELQQMLGRLLLMGSTGNFQSLEAFLKSAIDGNVDKVKTMISQNPDLVNTSWQGMNPLFAASHMGHLEVVKTLVESGASLDATDAMGNTALGAALIGKRSDVAQYLIEKGADVRVVLSTGSTLLHAAAVSNMADVVPRLIEKGCDVNAKDGQGTTALHHAIEKESNAATEALVKVETLDLNVCDHRGFSYLHQACFRGNALATELIVKRDKTVVNGQTKERMSALHIAAVNGRTDCIDRLLVHGKAMVDLKASGDKTPLHLASMQSQFSAIKELVKHKADVNARTAEGHTSLHFVLNARNVQQGNFLLFMIMTSGCSEELQVQMSCFLLEHGAIVDALDSDNHTPLDYCHSEVVKSALKNFIQSKPPGVIKFRESPPSKGLSELFSSNQGPGLGSGSGSSSGPDLGSRLGSFGGSGLRFGLGSSPGSGFGFGMGSGSSFGSRMGSGLGSEMRFGSDLGHGMGSDLGSGMGFGSGSAQGPSQCRVCRRAMADITVEPCNHRVMCEGCCVRVERCPQCCAVILSRSRNTNITISDDEPCKVQ